MTIDELKRVHRERRADIRARLAEFAEVRKTGSDQRLFEELIFASSPLALVLGWGSVPSSVSGLFSWMGPRGGFKAR